MTINYQRSAINYQVTSLEKRLRDFAQLAAKLKGDEKSEAQPFLFHFGWPGRCLIEMKPLRDPYRTLETPGSNRLRDAHAALDSAVHVAYSMKDGEDTLGFLLARNRELADEEAKGKPITPPGPPVPAGEAAEFMSKDCVIVPEGEKD